MRHFVAQQQQHRAVPLTRVGASPLLQRMHVLSASQRTYSLSHAMYSSTPATLSTSTPSVPPPLGRAPRPASASSFGGATEWYRAVVKRHSVMFDVCDIVAALRALQEKEANKGGDNTTSSSSNSSDTCARALSLAQQHLFNSDVAEALMGVPVTWQGAIALLRRIQPQSIDNATHDLLLSCAIQRARSAGAHAVCSALFQTARNPRCRPLQVQRALSEVQREANHWLDALDVLVAHEITPSPLSTSDFDRKAVAVGLVDLNHAQAAAVWTDSVTSSMDSETLERVWLRTGQWAQAISAAVARDESLHDVIERVLCHSPSLWRDALESWIPQEEHAEVSQVLLAALCRAMSKCRAWAAALRILTLNGAQSLELDDARIARIEWLRIAFPPTDVAAQFVVSHSLVPEGKRAYVELCTHTEKWAFALRYALRAVNSLKMLPTVTAVSHCLVHHDMWKEAARLTAAFCRQNPDEYVDATASLMRSMFQRNVSSTGSLGRLVLPLSPKAFPWDVRVTMAIKARLNPERTLQLLRKCSPHTVITAHDIHDMCMRLVSLGRWSDALSVLVLTSDQKKVVTRGVSLLRHCMTEQLSRTWYVAASLAASSSSPSVAQALDTAGHSLAAVGVLRRMPLWVNALSTIASLQKPSAPVLRLAVSLLATNGMWVPALSVAHRITDPAFRFPAVFETIECSMRCAKPTSPTNASLLVVLQRYPHQQPHRQKDDADGAHVVRFSGRTGPFHTEAVDEFSSARHASPASSARPPVLADTFSSASYRTVRIPWQDALAALVAQSFTANSNACCVFLRTCGSLPENVARHVFESFATSSQVALSSTDYSNLIHTQCSMGNWISALAMITTLGVHGIVPHAEVLRHVLCVAPMHECLPALHAVPSIDTVLWHIMTDVLPRSIPTWRMAVDVVVRTQRIGFTPSTALMHHAMDLCLDADLPLLVYRLWSSPSGLRLTFPLNTLRVVLRAAHQLQLRATMACPGRFHLSSDPTHTALGTCKRVLELSSQLPTDYGRDELTGLGRSLFNSFNDVERDGCCPHMVQRFGWHAALEIFSDSYADHVTPTALVSVLRSVPSHNTTRSLIPKLPPASIKNETVARCCAAALCETQLWETALALLVGANAVAPAVRIATYVNDVDTALDMWRQSEADVRYASAADVFHALLHEQGREPQAAEFLAELSRDGDSGVSAALNAVTSDSVLPTPGKVLSAWGEAEVAAGRWISALRVREHLVRSCVKTETFSPALWTLWLRAAATPIGVTEGEVLVLHLLRVMSQRRVVVSDARCLGWCLVAAEHSPRGHLARVYSMALDATAPNLRNELSCVDLGLAYATERGASNVQEFLRTRRDDLLAVARDSV